MWAIIGTWAMVKDGIIKASRLLEDKATSKDAIRLAINSVEDNPKFKSVGYGGLPNKNMEVELDSGFMDGDPFDIGAIMAAKNIKNPIDVAISLSKETYNNILAAHGAETYAINNGFDIVNMLTPLVKKRYLDQLKEENQVISAYDGSDYDSADTVCVCALDTSKNISVGTSTSGLFMKHPGRVGDSPLVGSGFYADSDFGAAAATGMGEDLMRRLISYEVVRKMKYGLKAMEACQQTLLEIDKDLSKKRDISDLSIIAIDKDGNMGAATNIKEFSFVYASSKKDPCVYLASNMGDNIEIKKASRAWVKEYMDLRNEI